MTSDVRDESGAEFVAAVTAPSITGDVDPALLARLATLISGHVEARVGATLALWRSIEDQGERDLTGSKLSFTYEIAGFEEGLLSLRCFTEEQVAGSGGSKHEVSTLMLDLTAGVAMGLDDIIMNGESKLALLGLVQDALLADYFDGDADLFALWASNLTTDDLRRVVLTPEGLEVWFDELEVGPPAIGMPVVAFDYSQLSGLLDPAGPAGLFG